VSPAPAALIEGARGTRDGRNHGDEVDVQNVGMDLHLGALGETLRALRLARGHTLGEVAAGTGLSPSFLSLVEGGGSDISTGRLHRVAQFLGVRLGDLLNMSTPEEVTIVRAAGRSQDGRSVHPLLDGRDDLAMSAALVELEAGARTGERPGRHDGEQFLFVVSGTVELVPAHAESQVLGPGDAAYLRSPVDEIRNAGDGRAVALLVASRAASGSGAAGDGAEGGIAQVVEQP
jgi:transcriptional regulator with XRE-family HTH domain